MKNGGVTVDNSFIYERETQLTVHKTCLFFAGDGFTVYDSSGDLVFRVETYAISARDHAEIVLMDPFGRCLLTVRRKVHSLPFSCNTQLKRWLFMLSKSLKILDLPKSLKFRIGRINLRA